MQPIDGTFTARGDTTLRIVKTEAGPEIWIVSCSGSEVMATDLSSALKGLALELDKRGYSDVS